MKSHTTITPEMIQEDMRYLQLLSRSFPTIAAASTEIINLEAIVNLPKGTEHFLADLHGEYEAFQHVLRNASGAIKRKVKELFGETLTDHERKELCTLIYYMVYKQGFRPFEVCSLQISQDLRHDRSLFLFLQHQSCMQ